jgi:peptidoglycan/LPS O-acetylase OafA/YrhL
MTLIGISAVSSIVPPHSDWGVAYFVFSRFNALNYLWCWLLGFVLWRHTGGAVYAALVLGSLVVLFGRVTPEPLAIVTYLISVGILIFSDLIRLPRWAYGCGEYLGDVSYPMYLFHLPSLILAYLFLGIRQPVVGVFISILISVAAFHLIDRYLKLNFIKPILFPAPVAQPVIRASDSPARGD